MASNASHMLEAALEQMDDIIAGNIVQRRFGGHDRQASECSSQLTPAPLEDAALRALQLTEGLRAELGGQGSEDQQDSLRKQVSTDTAHVILKWLERDEVSAVSFTSEGPRHSNRDGHQTRTHMDHPVCKSNIQSEISQIQFIRKGK
ncbi:Liprin-beta-2 [Liparis tanakae]|uniref:Liprin-beta-2 n=1 Tax=Liparis tanakae TaxID=230148 RepID=A0A4Z2ICV2_9TELE|nr:Liprin-beta-2 [Liparis tanakae]